MSSNMKIKKVCGLCQRVFVAKKTTTAYCSDECVKKAYKIRKRKEKIGTAIETTIEKTQNAFKEPIVKTTVSKEQQGPAIYVNILTLAAATGFSRSTLFRLMADKEFPRIQTSKRSVKFHLEIVINYLNEKYGSV